MKIPYDFLITDKIPFLYFTKSKIVMKDEMLTVLNGKEGVEIIPVAKVALLILGYGTSITQEAALFCSKHNCQIAFSRGGFNIHSCFYEGRYKNPYYLTNQYNLFLNNKLEFAKSLLKVRLKLNGEEQYFNKVDEVDNLEKLIALEAIYVKNKYKKYCEKYGIENFKREFNFEIKKERETEKDNVNRRLNILNNVLYSYITTVVNQLSLEPSMGFIHGKSRRGGLTFDISDILKVKIIFPLAFNLKIKEKEIISLLRKEFMKNNFYFVKFIIKICQFIQKGELINIQEVFNGSDCDQ